MATPYGLIASVLACLTEIHLPIVLYFYKNISDLYIECTSSHPPGLVTALVTGARGT